MSSPRARHLRREARLALSQATPLGSVELLASDSVRRRESADVGNRTKHRFKAK